MPRSMLGSWRTSPRSCPNPMGQPMADSTLAGQRRTELALSVARDCDFEAAGQLPKPYKPKRRTKNPPVIRPALGWLMSLPMEQAAKERQRKAERQAQPRATTIDGDWDIVIIRSRRRSRCMDWAATALVVVGAVLVLAAVGSGTNG